MIVNLSFILGILVIHDLKIPPRRYRVPFSRLDFWPSIKGWSPSFRRTHIIIVIPYPLLIVLANMFLPTDTVIFLDASWFQSWKIYKSLWIIIQNMLEIPHVWNHQPVLLAVSIYMWRFPEMEIPQNGWYMVKFLLKWMRTGGTPMT